MEWDEAKSKTTSSPMIGEDLAKHSIAELEARIAMLQAELQRVRTEIERKKARQSAAQDLFKR